MQYAKDEFVASPARCLESEQFSASFYERLLDTDEEVRAKFRFTNMKSQRVMPSTALQLCGDAVGGKPEGLAKLK